MVVVKLYILLSKSSLAGLGINSNALGIFFFSLDYFLGRPGGSYGIKVASGGVSMVDWK